MQSDLFPLLEQTGEVSCLRPNHKVIDCYVSTAQRVLCSTCRQLQAMFTIESLMTILGGRVDGIEIQCDLDTMHPKRKCDRASAG